MQVIAIDQPGKASSLIMQQRPLPALGAGEVLVRVAYAGINRADLFQREGSYGPPPGVTDIMGLELSGHVVATTPDAQRWQVGDEVCALLSGGGYAEYVAVRADHCLPIPQGLGLREAAALPECAATVWMALIDIASVQAGERVLIHGGTSGVGSLGIQMMQALGSDVWATVSTPEKAAAVESFGGTPIIYTQQDFVEIIKAQGGVDAVLDMVGGDYLSRNLSCLRPHGRMVSIAFLKGAKTEISAGGLMMKQLSWHGATLRGRSDAQKAAYLHDIETRIWPLLSNGTIRPIIDSTHSWQHAQEAHTRMEKGLHIGKILLQVAP